MDLQVPIILLSQLNRTSETRTTKEPELQDLRESGDIEQDASFVMFLWNMDEDDLLGDTLSHRDFAYRQFNARVFTHGAGHERRVNHYRRLAHHLPSA